MVASAIATDTLLVENDAERLEKGEEADAIDEYERERDGRPTRAQEEEHARIRRQYEAEVAQLKGIISRLELKVSQLELREEQVAQASVATANKAVASLFEGAKGGGAQYAAQPLGRDLAPLPTAPIEVLAARAVANAQQSEAARSTGGTRDQPEVAVSRPFGDAPEPALNDDAATEVATVVATPHPAPAPAPPPAEPAREKTHVMLRIQVRRGSRGLGLLVNSANIVTELAAGGQAEQDAQLAVGDLVVAVDGVAMYDVKHGTQRLKDVLATMPVREQHTFSIRRANVAPGALTNL